MKWAVVVPTCRPERFEKFLESWESLFRKHDVVIHKVSDPMATWEAPDFIPRHTDMCRSWGFYRAWQLDVDYILSLDDDVLPHQDIFAAYEKAFERDWPCTPYLSVGALTDTGLEMRGFPYQGRKSEAVVQYGGWIGVPDLDAATQIQSPRNASAFYRTVVPVPKGAAATCCAMNFAFRREYAPVMWQLPMLDGRYNRFGDIWSGLIQKRVLDALGKVMLINGEASVVHDRASDPFVNLQKEAPGLEPNESLWGRISIGAGDWTMLQSFKACTNRVADYFNQHGQHDYSTFFLQSRDSWLNLFD